MHKNTNFKLPLILAVVVALGCAGNAKPPAEINADSHPTEEAAGKLARNYLSINLHLYKQNSIDSIVIQGVYRAESMWKQEDLFVIPLEVQITDTASVYYYVLVGCNTGEVYPPNTDFRSVFRITEDKYSLYFDVGRVSLTFKANAPPGSEMESCILVRITSDTPSDTTVRVNDGMSWGFFVWLVKDKEGKFYFLTRNGVVHKIELSPPVVSRIYQSNGKE